MVRGKKIYYYIYKTTNLINGKIYVGQRGSLKKPTRDKYLGSGVVITKALRKYGRKNFKKEILEECDVSLLDEREIYWINNFKSNVEGIGYNLTKGGGGLRGYKYSDEQKKIISERNRGKKYPKEWCLNISNGRLQTQTRGKDHHWFNRKHATETKDKMSNSQKGELNHRYGKPAYNRRELYALNLENGVFEIFQNLKEAEEFFKIVNGTIRYYIRKEKPFKNHFIFY